MKQSSDSFGESRRRRWIQVMALILLTIIVSDVAYTSCDCLALSPSPEGLGPPGSDTGDACGDGCVPDCFCCSASLPAVPALFVADPSQVSEGPEHPAYYLPSGVCPVLDHVPLDIS